MVALIAISVAPFGGQGRGVQGCRAAWAAGFEGNPALCHSASVAAPGLGDAAGPAQQALAAEWGMASPQPSRLPADAALQAEVDALRLRAHANGARLASGASLAVAGLLVWTVQDRIPLLPLLAWLAALLAVLLARVLLAAAHRRAQQAAEGRDGDLPLPDQQRWLQRYRLSTAVHGLVWGLAAWLPTSLADPTLQASLVFVMVGLVIAALTLTMFDQAAALLFAAPSLVLLLARLGSGPAPLAPTSAVALGMGALLLAMLTLAGRRAERERRHLALAQRAGRASAQHVRDTQALLQQVFDHAGLGISVFDRDKRLRAWNDQVADLAGLPPAMLQPGVTLDACVQHLADRGAFGRDSGVEGLAQRLHVVGEGTPGVLRRRRPDGRLIEVRRNPLPDGGLVLFHVDITEREATRRAADEQQRMLALVLERTEQGFWYIDNDLRTTHANPAMCRMLGLERAQLLGRSIYEFVDAENRAIFDRGVALRAAGQAGGYEIALTRADGRQVHCFNNATPVFDAAGRKTGALGLFSDISAQRAAAEQVRQANEALAQKSRVLALTLDSLVQGVLNVDPEGRCTAWNRRFLELLQVPVDLMARRPQLIEVLDWQRAQTEFGAQLERMDDSGRLSVSSALRGEPVKSGHRYRRTRPDGTVLDVASYFADDGSLVRTFTDVTASVAAEQALIAARDEAEAANRAKSEFLSRMSHELRTPLNAILGFAQLLLADRDEPPGAGQRQRLDALVRGGQHLLALISDVLDVARIEGGNLQLTLQPVNLARLVPDALALVQPMAQERGVVLAPPEGLLPGGPAVVADATRLRQVMLNLLSNAIKFNRDGGEVRLRVIAQPAAGCVRLEVADQGAGIPPDQLPRLFQAFERLDMDGAVEGTGIGLALSRSLVALMHGSIGVESTPGQGSVFWLQLPACSLPAGVPDATLPALPPPALAGRPRAVLYIEDNDVNQLLMEGMLAHRPGIRLRVADLPEAGLAMAVAEPPDLVLLDIQLPGFDGFEVLRRLRQHPALVQVPVVAVSANAMPDDLAQARAAGFAAYLTKPVDMARLLALVDRLLAGGDAQAGW
jgi:PAS domain S-box-containing protein